MAEVAALGLRVDGVSNINQAEKSLDGFAASANKADKSTGQFGKTASGLKNPLSSLNNSLSSAAKSMLALGAATMSLAAVSRTLMGFEESMSQVAAITRANTKELQAMRDMAKQLGATTKFSASEAADGIKFLGMAGFTASESLASIPAVLNLATASAMGLSDAADIATNIMSGFGIAAENAANVADVLAAASSRSNTSVQQLGGAMSTVAPISAALGISLEDTAAAIGTLSDAGIQGERAGTAMRGALAALAGPTTQAQQVLKRLGLTVAEVNPQTNDLSVVFGRLRDAGLSTADAMTIFGREAASGALVLTGAAQRVGEFGQELQGAAGEAQRMADIMADNLGGDFKNLQSVTEALIIAMGEAGLTAIMRGAVQLATDLVGAAVNLVNQFGKVTNFIGSALSPAFNVIGHILTTLAKNADAFALALAGLYAPAVMGGIAALTRALGVGLVGAINAVTAAMIANPVGFLVRALAIAAAAVYAFRDDIRSLIGEDVVSVFRKSANSLIATMVSAYELTTAAWKNFPNIIGAVAIGAVNNFIGSINNLINASKIAINELIAIANKVSPIAIGILDTNSDTLEKIKNNFAEAGGEAAKAAIYAARKAFSTDYLGQFWARKTLEGFNDAFDIGLDMAGIKLPSSTPTPPAGPPGGDINKLREWIDETRIATAGARTMTEAYLAGGEAISALSRQVEIENAVLEHGAGARDAITSAINNQQAALDRLDIAKQINDLREQVKQSQGLVVVLGEQSKGYQQGQRAMAAYNREQQINNLLAGKNAEEVADLIELYRELWDQSDALAQTIDANNELNRLVESTRTAQERYNAELQRLVSLRPYAQTADQAEALNRAIDDIQRKNSEWFAFTEDALERMNSAFADMWRDAFDGSKNLFDGMKKGFRQMLAEMAHAAITQPIMISVGNALMGTNNPGGVGSGGGIFGAFNNARTGMTAGGQIGKAAQWLGQKVGSEALTSFGLGLSGTTAATGIASLGPALGASMGTSMGATAASGFTASFTAGISGSASATATGGLAGAGSLIGSALPWIGGALAIGSALGVFDDRVPTTRRSRQGASHMLPDGTFEVAQYDSRQSAEVQEAARDFAEMAVNHANDLFRRVGVDASIQSFQTLMESSILGDKDGVGSSGILRLGESLVDIGLAVEASWTRHGVGGWSSEELFPRLQADIQLTLLEAFQAAGDELPRILSRILEGADIRGMEVNDALALADAFAQTVAQIEQLQVSLQSLPFEYLRDVTFEASANLAEYAGGIEALQSGISDYFTNFHTVEEQLAYETRLLTEAFAEVGFVMPDMTRSAQESKDALRQFVESLDPMTEEGQRGIATAYSLAGRFADLANTMGAVSSAVDSVENLFSSFVGMAREALSAVEEHGRKRIAELSQSFERTDSLMAAVRDRVQQVATQWGAALDVMSKSVRDLRSQIEATARIQYEQARAAITSALASGRVPAGMNIQEVVRAAQSGVTSGTYASAFEQRKAYLTLANEIEALHDIAKPELDTAVATLERLEKQFNVLRGIEDYSGLSLKQLEAQLAQAFTSEEIARTQIARIESQIALAQLSFQQLVGINEELATLPGAMQALANAIGAANASRQREANVDRETRYLANNPDVLDAYLKGQGGNMSASELARYHYETYGKYEGRAFASGGVATPGIAMVGEHGPELVDFRSTGRVYSSNNTEGIIRSMVGAAYQSNAEVVRMLGKIYDHMTSKEQQEYQDSLNLKRTADRVGTLEQVAMNDGGLLMVGY